MWQTALGIHIQKKGEKGEKRLDLRHFVVTDGIILLIYLLKLYCVGM